MTLLRRDRYHPDMRCLLIAGVVAFSCTAFPGSALGAQPVPARELWEFPLGALFEPAALAIEPGAGFWNPATPGLRGAERLRVGIASLSAGAAQGVDGQLIGAQWRRSSGTSWSATIARTSVPGLIRTDSDPQSVGEIPYSSMLLSLGAARTLLPHVTVGAAARLRIGQSDQLTRTAVAADFGVVLHDLPFRDARIAASSFLWRPGRELEDRPSVLFAADARVAGSERTHEIRAGYAHQAVNRGARESGPFASVRVDRVEGRVSYLRTGAGSSTAGRLRSGLAVHYARYVVGLAREEGIVGLGPVYQFTLSTSLK